MRSRVSAQSHLEYRPSGFHWPRRVLKICQPSKKSFLLFSLRSHVLRDAKILAQKLTLLSDIAFAGVTERTMAIAPDIMETLLVELCRFLIEAADAEREMAPVRTVDAMAYDLACRTAAVETLRHAIAIRDRETARNPLRTVAVRLGVSLDEADPDWHRLAFRALRVMLDAQQENLRRDQGQFDGPTTALQAALGLLEKSASFSGMPANAPIAPMPTPPSHAPSIPPVKTQYEIDLESPAQTPPAPSELVTNPCLAREIVPSAAPSPDQNPAPSSCPTIEKGASDYIEARSLGYTSFKPSEQVNEKAGESWARNSGPNVRSTARLFSRIFDNRPFDRILDADLKAAWELVARIPRTYQAKTSKMSPQEAADDADATEAYNAELTRERLTKKGASPGKIESEILKGRIRRLRTATIYRHMQDFQRICVFVKKRGHLAENIMEDHIWETAEKERREILEEDNERLTWCSHLDALFRTPIYQEKLDDIGDPVFWAPLIAVHMGLRSEEVLQLYIADIQVIDDVPCIGSCRECGGPSTGSWRCGSARTSRPHRSSDPGRGG